MINEHDIKDMWNEQQMKYAKDDPNRSGQGNCGVTRPVPGNTPYAIPYDTLFPKKHPPQMKPSANEKQVAGDHYKKYGELQPWDVITAWGLGYLDGTALKYIARWRDKGGIDDIRKAIHFLEKFIEVEEGKNAVK